MSVFKERLARGGLRKYLPIELIDEIILQSRTRRRLDVAAEWSTTVFQQWVIKKYVFDEIFLHYTLFQARKAVIKLFRNWRSLTCEHCGTTPEGHAFRACFNSPYKKIHGSWIDMAERQRYAAI